MSSANPLRPADATRETAHPRVRLPAPRLVPTPGPRPAGAVVLHEVFTTQALRRPKAVAIRFGETRITYEELEARSNQVARRLWTIGVRRGRRVGLHLRRSPDAYAAMLGILKAGAAYVPIDPDCPAERARFILQDAGVSVLVTDGETARTHGDFRGALVNIGRERAAPGAESDAPLQAASIAGPADLCYIIYTSGSLGRPKGVMVEHRNAVHLVRTEGRLFRLRPRDRVYQGFTLAFDASVEEIWLAFHAGATLVPATPEMARSGPDLTRHLSHHRVTVLSCVPTQLATLEGDVPSLRLLILGGEACPPHLVQRWARPGRRIVNTYGPTEATVIATAGDLYPGRPVTIGRPIRGYRVHLLRENLEPVADGGTGEIFIGGAGVARGYVNLPDQNRERFLPEPHALGGTAGACMYRTGDLARRTRSGALEFLGRADTQVKLRGFRIELAEVESALLACGGVRSAACAVHQDGPELQLLIAYVVPTHGRCDEAHLKANLRARLPDYMVPARIVAVSELPRLASGKLDRGCLPAPAPRPATGPGPQGLTPIEREIASIWGRLLGGTAVGRDEDFFLNLGGHSLLAARAVSELRRRPRFRHLSMSDLYRHRTVAGLAAAIEAGTLEAPPAPTGADEPRCEPRPSRADPAPPQESAAKPVAGFAGRLRADAFQAGGLYLVFGFHAIESVSPYLIFWMLLEQGHSAWTAAGWGIAAVLAAMPVLFGAAIAAKWLLLGRVTPGRHPLRGAYHLRWWLVQSLVAALPRHRLAGTPLLPMFFRALGSRIGRDVYLGTERIAAFDLVSIGDGASVDDGSSLLGSVVEAGELRIGPVSVGRQAFVGARSVMRENTTLEDGARLDDLSLLPTGRRIPAGETWAGSPARRIESPVLPEPPAPANTGRAVALYAGLDLLLSFIPVVALVPGMLVLMNTDLLAHPWGMVAAAPLVGVSFVVVMTLETLALKWLVLGRARAGTCRLHGSYYVRCWFVEQLMRQCLNAIAPIYATLYVAPWYRALGARIGRRVELSTAASTPADLLEVADGGTVADEASIGEPRVERGWMTLAPVRVGRRAFVGNSGSLPTGVSLGDEALVGVLSIAPASGAAERPGSAWLGSPPIALPNREPSAGFRADRTYEPPAWLVAARGTFELLRLTLPPSGAVLVTVAVVTVAMPVWSHYGPLAALLLLPALQVGAVALVLLAVWVAKWLLIGRYRPFVKPLWTPFVWRLELVNALYEFLASPMALDGLRGTPWLPWYLRRMGARIGRDVHLETTGFLEWDLVEIGDRVELDADCVIQTHLFEDRMLKASRVRIGSDCSVGAHSVVLYDSRMGDGSRLDALSLLMKGETLPPGTAWTGAPPVPTGSC